MSKRKKLQDERAQIEGEMRSIATHATAEERSDFNEEESEKLTSLEKRLAGVKAKLLIEEEKLEADKRGKPVYPDSAPPPEVLRAKKKAGALSPTEQSWLDMVDGPSERVKPLHGARKFRDLFGETSNDNWESCDQFLKVVHSGLHHPELRSMIEGTPSSGGFLVPTEYAARFLDASLEAEIVRPRCQIEPMKSDTKKIGGFSSTDNSSSALFGGFTGTWLSETGTATDVDPELRMIELNTKKLGIYCKVSNELLQDGQSFESLLQNALIQSIGWHLDDACLNGSGAGQPLGVLNDPAKIEVAKETGQPADTIEYANLTKMFARLHPACVNTSVWVANPTCIPQLMELSIGVGTAGQVVPVMSESSGAFSLLTRPILFTEKLSTLGDAGDIILADFSQYTIGLRMEMYIEKSNAVNWSTDQTNYRITLRADGQGRWSGAFTPKNGDTLSWIISLAERA